MEDSDDNSESGERQRSYEWKGGEDDPDDQADSWTLEEVKGGAGSIIYTSREHSPRRTEEAEISEKELNLQMLSSERK